jgi:ketosteroid isomerase-like protein
MSLRRGPRVHVWTAPALFALLACCALAVPAHAQVSDPPVVVDAYERARSGQDVDAATGLFADDAVLRVEGRQIQQFTGKDQIRGYLLLLVARSSPRVTSSRHVVGNTVTWTEHDAADLAVEAVIRDGKIRSLVYRPAPAVGSSDAVPIPLLAAAAIAVLCLLTIAVHARVTAPARAGLASASRLRGRMLADLDHWHGARGA